MLLRVVHVQVISAKTIHSLSLAKYLDARKSRGVSEGHCQH